MPHKAGRQASTTLTTAAGCRNTNLYLLPAAVGTASVCARCLLPQASYDPNAVAAVLAQFPYHVDSLLAMNELYRSMGEAQVRHKPPGPNPEPAVQVFYCRHCWLQGKDVVLLSPIFE